jgi:hypothetical protein
MLVDGKLVVKLPRARVQELVADGSGAPFDPGHGRVMREWAAIAPTDTDDWICLAQEARTFVASPR